MGPETHKRIWLMHTATGHFYPIEPSPRCLPEDHAALNPHIVKIEDCISREIIWRRSGGEVRYRRACRGSEGAEMNLNLPNSAIMDRLIRIKDRLTDRAERDAISDAVNRIYELAMALKTADFSGNGNVMRHAAIALRCPDGFEPLCDGFEASTSESLEGKLDDALKHVARALK